MRLTKLKKKGQLNLEDVPSTVVTLLILALVIAVSAIVLVDFRDSTGGDACLAVNNDFVYNATSFLCHNSSNSSLTGDPASGSVSWNATTDGLTATDNVSNQIGTVGTIVIAAVLLGLIVTAFVFFNRR